MQIAYGTSGIPWVRSLEGVEVLESGIGELKATKSEDELVLEAIQKAEGIEATEEEVEAEIAKFAQESKKTVEEFKSTLRPGDIDYLKDQVAIRKTVELIKDAAIAE